MVAFFEQHSWGRYWLMTCVIAGMLVSPSLVSAQDGTPEPETLVNEDVVPTPTPIPPTPTPVPPTPTPVPPAPTTAIVANEVAPTATTESTEPRQSTTDSAGAGSPTAAPTDVEPTAVASPSPTPVPAPNLNYSLAVQPSCKLAPDQDSDVASGGSVDYLCTDTVRITGTNVDSGNVSVTWAIDTSIAHGWIVQLLPPANEDDSQSPAWTSDSASSASFIFDQADPVGTGFKPEALESSPMITFRLRVHRPACELEPQPIHLTHDVAVLVASEGATVTDESSTRKPLLITPTLAPIPEPSVAFDAPLNFGEVGVTATGPETTVKRGTLDMTVSNLNHTCGVWNLVLSATPLTDESGAALEGSHLVVVSINDEPLPDDGCVLTTGCALRALSGGQDAPSSLSITLNVELRMPEQPELGSFNTSISAALHPASAD